MKLKNVWMWSTEFELLREFCLIGCFPFCRDICAEDCTEPPSLIFRRWLRSAWGGSRMMSMPGDILVDVHWRTNMLDMFSLIQLQSWNINDMNVCIRSMKKEQKTPRVVTSIFRGPFWLSGLAVYTPWDPGTVTPRNTGRQGTNKFHLLLADFRYCQYRK